jgi:hypothetical protein
MKHLAPTVAKLLQDEVQWQAQQESFLLLHNFMDGSFLPTADLSNFSPGLLLSSVSREHSPFHVQKALYSFLWQIQIASLTFLPLGTIIQ